LAEVSVIREGRQFEVVDLLPSDRSRVVADLLLTYEERPLGTWTQSSLPNA